MQKERLEEMKRKFDNYLQRFPDPESGSLITLDNFKEYILNPDKKDILDYIFEKSDSANRDFYLRHCPRFCVNRKLEDSSFILESCSFLFTQYYGKSPIYRNSFLQGISRTKFVDV